MYLRNVKYCYILTFDRAVNQRCTCVNKRKKKRKQVDVMKEYMPMPEAVESVGAWRPVWGPDCRLKAVALSDPRLSNPSQDAEEVLSGLLKITQRAMVKRRSRVNIAICPCLHLSLTHHRNINPFENKVWEIHIFINKCVRSFIELRKWLYNNTTSNLKKCLFLISVLACRNKCSYFYIALYE